MKSLSTALGAAILMATPALAHHSYAMFDSAKVLKLTGTVLTFSWSNPHTYIEIQAPDASGAPQKWGVECTSPAVLARAGWRSTTLKPGDQVTISVHPLHGGELGGSFVSVVLPDGRTLTDKPPAAS